jgi:hypothetical protein
MVLPQKKKRKTHNFNLVFLRVKNQFLWRYFKQTFHQNNGSDHTNLTKSILGTMLINRGVSRDVHSDTTSGMVAARQRQLISLYS